MITNLKRLFLEQYPGTLTEKDKADLKEFYTEQGKNNKKAVEYFKKLQEPEQKDYSFTYEEIKAAFFPSFKQLTGIDFVLNNTTEYNIKTLLYYFAGDARFLQSKLIYNNADLDKGLLIVGDYGTGKSSAMKTIQMMLRGVRGHSFGFVSANQVVQDYENCEGGEEKESFWQDNNSGRRYFDDIKTEQLANNYGKKNIMKDLIEKRYEKGVITFASCNYQSGSDRMADAVKEFESMYGGRVYDRLFEMFNIIEWKGESFRR